MPKVNDLNRQRKIYPLLRQKPVFGEVFAENQGGTIIEVAILDFNNQDSYLYTFKKSYTAAPNIGLSPEDENVSVFISSLNLLQVKVESSAPFTGKVHLQVYNSGS
tara:strand:+ start:44 stop:361 length:318 start_codon:yes stop_codon:yes gene_type:complete